MDRLIAQDDALRQCHAFSKAQDALDKDLFISLFEPGKRAILDLSKHIPGMQPLELTSEEFWNAIAFGMSGFTATHHQLGNAMFECDNTLQRVTVTGMVIAYHCIEEYGALESVTSRATQIINLKKVGEKWAITRFAVERDVPMDNPDLYTKAQERAKAGKGRVEAQPLS